MLVYYSRLKLFSSKLKLNWLSLFIITEIFPHGAVEIKSLETYKVFKVNGHRLKPYYDGFQANQVRELQLCPQLISD